MTFSTCGRNAALICASKDLEELGGPIKTYESFAADSLVTREQPYTTYRRSCIESTLLIGERNLDMDADCHFIVEGTITRDGTVRDFTIIRRPPQRRCPQNEQIAAKIAAWRFLPAMFNGEPVETLLTTVSAHDPMTEADYAKRLKERAEWNDGKTMKKRVLRFTLLALWVSATAASQPVVVGQRHSLRSTVLNEERTYRVQLPASYGWAKDRRYSVLYVLDGATHFQHTFGSVSYLAAQGEIPEMIVVALDSTVRIRDFTQSDWSTAWVGGGGAANFKRFLSGEFIPNIERTYRTNGFRVLAGHSAGGQFVLYCLTSEPSLFQAYFAFSPSLEWDDNLPQKSLAKSFEAARSLKAFLYVARSDDSGRALADYEQLVDTLKTKSPQGFRWHSQPYPDETHGSIPLLAQIEALRRLYSGYRFHGDLVSKGVDFAEKHFEAVSKAVGWPLPVPESVINELAYEALATGKTEAAVALFKRNVQANPNSANAYDGLADGHEKAENWKEAAEASARAAGLAAEFDLPNKDYFARQAAKMKARLEQESTK